MVGGRKLDVRNGSVEAKAEPVVRVNVRSSPIRGEGTTARRAWRARYVARVVVFDAVSVFLAAGTAHLLWFGVHGPGRDAFANPSTSPLLILALTVVWLAAMLAARAYEQRFLWIGPEEFRRVFFASALLLATVGTVSWAFNLGGARGFVVVALPLATVLTLGQRLLHRRWLHRQRERGRYQQTALLVGHRDGVAALHAQIQREAYHGYRIIGCCVPSCRAGDPRRFDGLHVLGDLDDVVEVVERYEVDAVAVLPSPELDGAALRTLGWDLEETPTELLLAPAATEVAGPRVRIRLISGLPLMQVERPQFKGMGR